MSKICPKAENCPIFSGVLSGKDFSTKAYKINYCEAGEQGRSSCKRWEAANILKSIPDGLLPNSTKTIEEISKELLPIPN